ncbi:MAG TPA: uL15m family ribosomal protein [Methanoculleus sp.]|jgi:large subunit ribosomal protein L15|uniref:Large ribosomal subunit protein uL15 n=1 Tax=Methanoculleus receptaculi TaxID=394967 RepID=A0AAX4FUC9_9EURY|nr:uL15 family ribosomal protein [Methanoculleus receptaculi]MBP7298808.1 uL15 family ribosomal protein [Methanoculleus sp.]MDI3506231.1 large subunit ribosomal protein [Methanomicrobiaceae archaeon]MBP8675826.1 uL15 family ribosomal protein [Methanoculleus sp.]MDK2863404.1 large subunit ribosomal protein [Methanomicrobiaceae archaeon]WOX57551.1 uL15m family ribosomal protein [Methanoculleus receptaculi]
MPVNKRSKYRGSRTCGGGTHKNRRGAGNRGGRGRAGQRDHRFSHFYLRGEISNGKHGFVNKTSVPVSAIDVGDIDQMIEALVSEGFATREGDLITLDATEIGIEKVLGGGQVTHRMSISARAFSERARAKIEEMGGQAMTV